MRFLFGRSNPDAIPGGTAPQVEQEVVVLIRSALSKLDSFVSPIEARTVCRLPTANAGAAIYVEVFGIGRRI